MTFRTRIFLGVFGASAVAVGVTVVLYAFWMRAALLADIEADLVHRAGIAVELIGAIPGAEAGREDVMDLASLLGARVTLVAADGTVLSDSSIEEAQLPAIENHGQRPEIATARGSGSGVDVRRSRTTGIENMYAALAVDKPPIAFVRVALPLNDVERRLALVWPAAGLGLGTGLLAALLLTWMMSAILSRRIRTVADAAARYEAGDFSVPAADYERDEIGRVATTLDRTARNLGQRLGDMARDRAHTDAILTGMTEGIILVNAAGRLVLANPAVGAMLSLPDPAAGRHYTEVVRQPAITAQLSEALAGRVPPAVEVQLQPDGRRTYTANAVPVGAERGGGAVLVLHDVTDVRRADQVRRDFVANVSHELRTPLTAIRGYVEALREAGTPGDAARFLEVIERQALRMERLVQDLLQLARLDAGQDAVETVACPIGAIVQAIERDMQGVLESRQQRVLLDVPAEAATVDGDPAKLHDILNNLIANASTYSPPGGSIDVSVRRADGGVTVTVADRGPGVPDADLERIFERFYRVDRSRQRDPGGTGLGLSIVRHLVELHGGRVWAAAREGGGAAFTIFLPDRSAAQNSRPTST
jgi:two-component system phosphate regulon sensor histidine kinase PhoR